MPSVMRGGAKGGVEGIYYPTPTRKRGSVVIAASYELCGEYSEKTDKHSPLVVCLGANNLVKGRGGSTDLRTYFLSMEN